MKKSKRRIHKITAMLLALILCLPFILACGGGNDSGNATEPQGANANENENQEAGGSPAEQPTDPPAPTEPPTERETAPPTEPPTDPPNLPGPDLLIRQEEAYEIIPGARYYLWSPNSGLYLTVDGDFKFAGLSQDDFTGGPEQMFVFETVRIEETESRTNYIYKIRVLGTKDGYLDVEDGEAAEDGASVVVTSEPEGEISHEWTVRPQARGRIYDDAGVTLPVFSVHTMASRNSRVLDVSGVIRAEWDQETKELTVQFDSGRTSMNAISKAVAEVGHDTDMDRADDEVYAALHECCLYRE